VAYRRALAPPPYFCTEDRRDTSLRDPLPGDRVYRRERHLVKDPSDARRDVEKFIAAGGGTFAGLLAMLRDEQPVEAPAKARLAGVASTGLGA
jgi:hypothetical protein